MKLDVKNAIRAQPVPTLNPARPEKEVECPCWGCPQSKRCSDEELACQSYHAYNTSKSTYAAPSTWKDKPRIPSRIIFLSM